MQDPHDPQNISWTEKSEFFQSYILNVFSLEMLYNLSKTTVRKKDKTRSSLQISEKE